MGYIGPSVLTRLLSSNTRNAFISSFGIGYLDYSELSQSGIRSFATKGSTFGIAADLGYDLSLGKSVSMGIAFSTIIGSLNKAELEDNGKTQTINFKEIYGKPQSLIRYNLSIGLRVNL